MLIRQLDITGKKLTKREYKELIPRANLSVESAMIKIAPILQRVKAGDEAELIKLATEFDGVTPKSIRVSSDELQKALAALDPAIRKSLELAIDQVRKYHRTQLPTDSSVSVIAGGDIDRTFRAVDRVGLYVPGGIASYPSSVIMNVVPAQIAGVTSIALASPPQKENNGLPNSIILATCQLLGVTEVYAVGGAQAIAMFAYGVKNLCASADLVTGPGNIYVAAAKRSLRGLIGIDSEAGPTEIAILADDSALAIDVAADLISQAEHDEMAAAVLVTDSKDLIAKVVEQLVIQVDKTKHKERVKAALSGNQSAIVLVDSIEQGVDVINAYAPEHLELILKNSKAVSAQIRNAGAIFLDRFSPVSLGDYAAGSNHVLPTGGCACHSSGLSVNTFMRNISVIHYDRNAFNQVASEVITLANAEDLPAHASAMQVRLEK
ncbi:MAG: histidinol dehydrogenase [Actinobacteria bacterium]|nr:histidinol dehydrogenase [Actinomycetota bacterium]